MGVLVYCDNKGCGESMEPVLNLESNDVECTSCGKTINNISSFTKNSMKTLGQIKKPFKASASFGFMVMCAKCDKNTPPKLAADKKTITCSVCNESIEGLPTTRAHLVREYLKGNIG